MQLQAIIFDVDGTLADTERDGHLPAFNAAFAAAKVPWRWSVEQYGDLLAVTGGKERMRHFAERFDPGFLARPEADATIRAMHAAKTRHYLDYVASGAIPLRPGIARLIREAKQCGLRLAIATTTTPENVTALLEASFGTDGAGLFEVIGAGDAVERKKPAPDIYDWVLRRLGIAPQSCLALEDSANGLKSSLAAGIATVVTVSEYTHGQDFTGAAAVLADLGEAGAPFSPLAGDGHGHRFVDVELLRIWHRQFSRDTYACNKKL